MDIKFHDASQLSEFVGTATLDTIGLVIGSVDRQLHKSMNIPDEFRALGIFSSRTGAAGQITAIDDAVKMTNTQVLTIDLPRDTKGWGGHGNYIVLGAENLEDAREAIEIALELTDKNAGELYLNDAGHLEFAYTANAGQALNKMFGAPIGHAFGFICGSPASAGLVMADRALKSAEVELLSYMTPSIGTSHSNEVILTVTGDAAAVKEAVITGREIGTILLNSMGEPLTSVGTPFLK
ncbi:MAG: microcompartment protein PduB [Eubacterium sp.]|nr:microcompartment protein PduB [Candidatus Colimonas fimequi]